MSSEKKAPRSPAIYSDIEQYNSKILEFLEACNEWAAQVFLKAKNIEILCDETADEIMMEKISFFEKCGFQEEREMFIEAPRNGVSHSFCGQEFRANLQNQIDSCL